MLIAARYAIYYYYGACPKDPLFAIPADPTVPGVPEELGEVPETLSLAVGC